MAAQQRLFPLAFDESKLGPNQRDVLARIDRFGTVSAREAGRIVYLNRGQNPDRISKEWLRAAGFRVLISLRRHGLVRGRRDGTFIRPRGGGVTDGSRSRPGLERDRPRGAVAADQRRQSR